MNKTTTLLLPLLLVCSSITSANRPGLEDRAAEGSTAVMTPAASQTSVSQQISGDVLEIQQGETIEVKLLDFPRRGMTMKKVLNELGKPNSMSDAVGKPPITNWVYNDRTVTFEYSTVIHVVATP